MPLYHGFPSQLRPAIANDGQVFVNYRYPGKVPLHPLSGRNADPTKRTDCGSLDMAEEVIRRYGGSDNIGLGIVLSRSPQTLPNTLGHFILVGIDCDHKLKATDESGRPVDTGRIDEAKKAAQWNWISSLGCYVELSPSNRGFRGFAYVTDWPETFPRNIKDDFAEIYFDKHYLTITGNTLIANELTDITEALLPKYTELLRSRGVTVDRSEIVADAEQTVTDEEIYNRAANAKNGEKFVRLWNGGGSAVDGSDKSGSAVDQALVNVLAFYTQNFAQIERLWLASPQGQREKTQNRPAYRESTIRLALSGRTGLPTDGVREAVQGKLGSFNASLAPVVSHAPGEPLRVVAVSALSDCPPPREWQVDDMIPAGNVTLLYGDGGTGKSLLSLQLAVSTATGRTWLGKAVKYGPALYFSAEDDTNELNRRIVAVCKSEELRLADLTALEICSFAGEDALMSAPVSAGSTMKPTVLYGQIEQYISIKRPTLLVLDTLADLFGGNENDRAQARQFIGQLRHFCVAYGTTIVVLAHPSLSGINSGSGASGSTAWGNSVRSRIYFERVKGDNGTEYDPDIRRLVVMKSNYGRVGAEIHVRWQDGVFAKIGETDKTHAAVAKAEQEADEFFLSLLATYAAQGRFVTDKPCSTYAPKVFSGDPSAGAFKKESLKRAMDRLFAQGRIRLETYGFKSRARTRIALNAGTSNPLPTP